MNTKTLTTEEIINKIGEQILNDCPCKNGFENAHKTTVYPGCILYTSHFERDANNWPYLVYTKYICTWRDKNKCELTRINNDGSLLKLDKPVRFNRSDPGFLYLNGSPMFMSKDDVKETEWLNAYT